MTTPYSISVTIREDDEKKLAQWWCELNRWGWPAELGGPEIQESKSRMIRSAIMEAIEAKITHKRCIEEWNRQ